jgi:hypothetical protein
VETHAYKSVRLKQQSMPLVSYLKIKKAPALIAGALYLHSSPL